MRPRLIATDLDGTLLRSDGSVSERTAAALLAAEGAGITVVFVTGRPLRWARDVFPHVGGHGRAIISNGALVWDVAADRPIEVRAIAPEVGLRACSHLREAVPGTTYAVETLAGIALEPTFLERHRIPDGAPRGPIEAIFAAPVLKLLARHEELGPQDFWDAAEEAIGDLVEITWSSSSSLLEISARDVTKASTLEAMAAAMGVDRSEVVAFGDMPNDLPLLAWAGTGYAMANAHPSVLAATTHRAPSNDEDGVAQVIEHLIA
ncbi:MAG TPA: HAD family hydrolase [Marmoricola sp.]